MRRTLLHIAVASILAAGSLPSLHAQRAQDQTPAKWTPARTPDGHPDMQGMWARRGVAMAEANPPNAFAAALKGSELMELPKQSEKALAREKAARRT